MISLNDLHCSFVYNRSPKRRARLLETERIEKENQVALYFIINKRLRLCDHKKNNFDEHSFILHETLYSFSSMRQNGDLFKGKF